MLCRLSPIIFLGHKLVGDTKKPPLHRAFSLFIFNPSGELLIQKRAASKLTFPQLWSNSCCSHPLYMNGKEESIREAVLRRAQEELGIKLDVERIVLSGRVLYSADSGNGYGEHERIHCHVPCPLLSFNFQFIVDHLAFYTDVDAILSLNSEEIAATNWVTRNELMRIDQSMLTPWFQLISERLLLSYNDWNRLVASNFALLQHDSRSIMHL